MADFSGLHQRRWPLFVSLLLSTTASIAWAQPGGIATDGTVGRAVTLSAPGVTTPVTVDSTLGTIKGSNLFHSFDRFGINSGQAVTFTDSTKAPLSNVLSRVTGGSVTDIQGTLKSDISGANFWLINPAGVVFGPNASVDVKASFHASTANEIRFGDGNVFSATKPAANALTTAPPQAFGFLGPAPAANITLNGTLLSVPSTASITLSGGNISMVGGKLAAPRGQVNLTAVGNGGGNVSVATGEASVVPSGAINLTAGAGLSVTGNGSGMIRLRSGTLTLKNSAFAYADNSGDVDSGGGVLVETTDLNMDSGAWISADSLSGTGHAGTLTVNASGNVRILSGSKISSYANAAGNAGSVKVSAKTLVIDGQGSTGDTGILTQAKSQSTGTAGTVTVTTRGDLRILAGGKISSSTSSTGNAGSITVNAGSITIDAQNTGTFTAISSQAASGNAGNAGTVTVTANGDLRILAGGEISSTTFGKGNAGAITVNVGSLTIDGQNTGDFTAISSQAGTGSLGNAGTVTVTARGDLRILAGGAIDSSTLSKGNAGAVTVSANTLTLASGGVIRSLTFDEGRAGKVSVSATDTLSLLPGGVIDSSTESIGSAGGVTINAGNLTIDATATTYRWNGIYSQADSGSTGNAGSISVAVPGNLKVLAGGEISSSTLSTGNAGTVTVKAGTITIDDKNTGAFTSITSLASPSSKGNAGTVTVTASGDLRILAGGKISSSTFSKGNAGTVTVQADTITIDAQNTGKFTAISSQAASGSAGSAGTVTVTASGDLRILAGGEIDSSTFGTGNAGLITVNAGTVTIDAQNTGKFTAISSQAAASSVGTTGNAGSIMVTASGNLSVLAGGKIDSSTFTAGNAGTVTVKADTITIDAQNTGKFTAISSQAATGSLGNAGTVTVTASNDLNILAGGKISSSTFGTGNAGTVTVKADTITLDAQNTGRFTAISSQAATNSVGTAGTVTVTASGDLRILAGGEIDSSTFSTGNAGSVTVNAGTITIDAQNTGRFTAISSQAAYGSFTSSGNAGSITVTASGDLRILAGGKIDSSAFSIGNAGTVTVKANTITIDGQNTGKFTAISSQATSGSSGNAGTVTVTANGDLRILAGGTIDSSTFSKGNAGTVTVNADSITIDGEGHNYYSGIFGIAWSGSLGTGGSINVTTKGDLIIRQNGAITAQTQSFGDAGSVTVVAGRLSMTGDTPTDWITSRGLTIPRFSYITSITSQSTGAGNAGSVSIITSGDASLDNALIGTLSSRKDSKNGGGNAGSVSIMTGGTLSLNNNSLIDSATTNDALGGTVIIRAANLLMDNDGRITSAVFGGLGNAGAVSVFANAISLTNASVIDSSNSGGGQGGDVQVSGGTITVSGTNSAISAVADGTGVAGVVSISGNVLNLFNSGSVTTVSKSGGGGGINIHLSDMLYLNRGKITTEVGGGLGDAGGIFIDPHFVVLNHGLIRANAIGGNGGNITIKADTFISSIDSVVEASSQTAVSGTISNTAPKIDTAAATAVQSHNYNEISNQLGFNCAGRNGHAGSGLSSSGRGGMAVTANMAVPAFYPAKTPTTGADAVSMLPLVANMDGTITIACQN